MLDVVAPIQSCFGCVARRLDNLVSEPSIERLLNLEMTLGNTGFSNTYSPWDEIDHFGRDRLRDAIHIRSPEQRKVSLAAKVSSDQPGSSKSTKANRGSKEYI